MAVLTLRRAIYSTYAAKDIPSVLVAAMLCATTASHKRECHTVRAAATPATSSCGDEFLRLHHHCRHLMMWQRRRHPPLPHLQQTTHQQQQRQQMQYIGSNRQPIVSAQQARDNRSMHLRNIQSSCCVVAKGGVKLQLANRCS
jgi:hypothetical protein